MLSSVVQEQASRVGTAVGDALVAIVGVAAALVIGWLRAKFSAPARAQAALAGTLAAEQWHRDEVAAGRDKPTSAAKKAKAKAHAKRTTPLRHRAWVPGTVGDEVEDALPAMRRASEPPRAT